MTTDRTFVAVDLGATSGRVMLARVGPGRLDLQEVHRFANEPVVLWESGRETLHWNCVGLFAEIVTGLRRAADSLGEGEQVGSIGIDAWAVDYALLDREGGLLGVPYSYRDGRGARGAEAVHRTVSPEELYRRNGLQYLPFNTIYQLAAEPRSRLESAATMLLLPDLFSHWLTGAVRAEVTNASTTGLLDVSTRTWDVDLAARIGLPPGLLPELVAPGERLGTLLPHIAAATGLPASTPVVAVGSHDTASAVVAVPASAPDFAYISSGTWSLVGLELDQPVLTDAARTANFTNEGGVDGRVRFLRNVMGLWMLNESLRTWELAGSPTDLTRVLAAAAELPEGGPVFDPDDPVFLAPGDMPARIEAVCRASGRAVPADRPSLVRAILDSLAAAYAQALADAERLSGRQAGELHLVGGGSRNALLCRLVANATGRPVSAGPVEATAMGNALVQARGLGVIEGDLAELRASLRASLSGRHSILHFQPGSPLSAAHPKHHPTDRLERTS